MNISGRVHGISERSVHLCSLPAIDATVMFPPDLIDEESQDESPPAAVASQARADVYRPTTLPSTSGINGGTGGQGKDNLAVAVDTDFPTVFEGSHDGRM